jgi:hypothetical protein
VSQKTKIEAGREVQIAEHLSSKCEALSSNPSTTNRYKKKTLKILDKA